MSDLYVYEGTNVLKNKFEIKDREILEKLETELTVHNLLNVDEKVKCAEGKFNFEHLKKIHKHIFGDLYDWAGQPRVIDIYKNEVVLDGLSVEYSHHKIIEKDMKKAIDDLNSIKWDRLSQEQIVKEFTPRIAAIWKIHAFREGNTRTTMTFACQYAEAHGFKFEKEVFREGSGYVRNSLVMVAIGEYAEPKYLEGKIREALGKGQEEKLKEKYLTQLLNREKEILRFIRYKIQENPSIENIDKLIGYAQSKVQESNSDNVVKYKDDLNLFKQGKSILEGVEKRVIKEAFYKEIGVHLDDSTTEKIRRLNKKENMFHCSIALRKYNGCNRDIVKDIIRSLTNIKQHIR
ncbi:Fic/DOC family protein [Clostridium sp.]|uniref:Fic/DOC family protein n=1 Tax=Clostridium sp. TaxID=1506 RepID=UPI003F374CC4